MTNEQMEFPETWEEYEKDYGFNDSEEVYTNNSRLIPSFRVKQWLDHLPSIQPKPKTECSCSQIKWERDTAIAQLKELGYGLGEKPKTDVLDKIRAELHATAEMHEDDDYYLRDEWIDKIINKYKAESEEY